MISSVKLDGCLSTEMKIQNKNCISAFLFIFESVQWQGKNEK